MSGRANAVLPAPTPSRHDVGTRLGRILFSSGAAAAWEWDIARKRIIGDQGFALLYGLTEPEAAAGISPSIFFSIVHPQDRDRIRLAMGGMLRGAEVLSKEYRVLAPDGAIRWFHARGRNQYDDEGLSTRISGVLIDITEQKRLEETLRIAQTAGGVGTFAHVAGYGTATVSAQFCRLLGLHLATDLPVRTINAVVVAGDPPIIDAAAAAEPGAVSRIEFRVVRADDGETRWLMRRGEYLRDSETAGVRFSGVIYDITDAKRTEELLRSLNETLETRVEERTRERDRIWRVSHDLLGVADLEGRWVSVNPAWQALLGWREAEIVGRTSGWLEHPGDSRSIRHAFDDLAAGERWAGFENRLRVRGGGYRWLSWTAVAEAGCFYCVARDVTAEKEAAEALAVAEEQLRQSSKMEAVGQLTGGIAHDFNNLLTGIAGSLEAMQQRIAKGDTRDLQRFIASAEGECKRAAALTHRLLAFSRRQTLDPKPTDIAVLVAGLEDLIRRTVGPSVAFEVVLGDELWTTLIDRNQLENAVLNLSINARDAMQEGGRLTIEAVNRCLDEPLAREYDVAAGEYVILTVADTGTGMTPEVIAHAFDPFFTTKPVGHGTGLGLSMVYGFARQSGGQVRIKSTLGKGTRVCLYLPRHHGAAEATTIPAVTDEAVRPAIGETVLVVDDEPIVRMLIADVLQGLNYRVIEAKDGAGGLKVLRSEARIDLLVTDVGLPGALNGRQMAEAARELRPGLQVLFITGYAEHSVLNREKLERGMHVMTKPFQMEALAARVSMLMSGDASHGSAPAS